MHRWRFARPPALVGTSVGPVDRGTLLSHLDSTPADPPRTACEYRVTHVLPYCGGESDVNTFDPPQSLPTATPPVPGDTGDPGNA